jgi:hypothetical protein
LHSSEIITLDQGHHDVTAVFRFPKIVKRNNIGMVELGAGIHLPFEAFQVFTLSVLHHLDGHFPLQRGIESAIDRTETASPELFVNLITQQARHLAQNSIVDVSQRISDMLDTNLRQARYGSVTPAHPGYLEESVYV